MNPILTSIGQVAISRDWLLRKLKSSKVHVREPTPVPIISFSKIAKDTYTVLVDSEAVLEAAWVAFGTRGIPRPVLSFKEKYVVIFRKGTFIAAVPFDIWMTREGAPGIVCP